MMTLAIGCDHAGFQLKAQLVHWLGENAYQLIDHGTHSETSVDYPQVAALVAHSVAIGKAEFGVLVCGSGVGVAIAANRFIGVRAVNAHDPDEAKLARRHNNANVVTLAGRRIAFPWACEIVDSFFRTQFEGGRHERRVQKIDNLGS